MILKKPLPPAALLGVLCITVFLALTCVLILSPLLVGIAEEFGTTIAVAGQLMSAMSFSWAFMAIAAGALSDTYGKKPVLLLGLGLTILSVFGSAFANDYSSLLILRLLTGFGAATLPTIAFATVADLFPPEKRGKAFGIVISSVGFGMALGVPGVAYINDMGGWRLPFIFLGYAFLILFVVLYLFFPNKKVEKKKSQSFMNHFKKVARIKVFWAVLFANSLQVTSFVAIFGYLAAFLTQRHGMSSGETVIPLMIVGFGGVFGSLIGGPISISPHRFRWIVTAFSCSAILSATAYSISDSAWVTIFLSFSVSLLLSISPPTILTIATHLAGESKTTATGLFSFSNQVGTIGGASLGGLSLFLGGFPYVGYLGTIATLISIFVLWLVSQKSNARSF